MPISKKAIGSHFAGDPIEKFFEWDPPTTPQHRAAAAAPKASAAKAAPKSEAPRPSVAPKDKAAPSGGGKTAPRPSTASATPAAAAQKSGGTRTGPFIERPKKR